MSLPPLKLKAREDRRLRAGHEWIFSNEIDVSATALGAFGHGEFVNVLDHGGTPLGTAVVNPSSLICARMVSRRADRPLDRASLRVRLQAALALRERLGFGDCYRLVYGESDGLPGLVVDRHADVLVVQIATAGMQRLADTLVAELVSLLAPSAVLLRNDSPARQLEGLENEVRWAFGDAVDSCVIEENGVKFAIAPASGQKTGWFYDHRLTRARACGYARGARVLDLFCYLGGFGVQAVVAGATEAVCVDSSGAALGGLEKSAALNGIADRVHPVRGDVFDVLKQLAQDGERFDLVIADPPAFARRKRDLKAAVEAYRRLNRLAMRIMGPEGILVAASCSSHVDRRGFLDTLRHAARGAARRLTVLESGGQGPDHPIHPAMPETDYLKSYITLVRS